MLLSLPLATLTGVQWLIWLALINNVVSALHPMPWLAPLNWWVVVAAFLVFITPRVGWASRCWVRGCCCPAWSRALTGAAVRSIYGSGWRSGWPTPVAPRIWPAHRGWCITHALGNQIGKGVDLHSAPPVTGMLTLGHRCSIEPEVDLTGHWIDGDLFHVGPITVGNDTTVGARSTLFPGTTIGKGADIAPGSGVTGKVKNKQYWRGSPPSRPARPSHPGRRSARPGSALVGDLRDFLHAARRPAAGVVGAGLALLGWAARDAATLQAAVLAALPWIPVATLVSLAVYAALTVIGVRMMALGLRRATTRCAAGSAGNCGPPSG